MIDVTIAYNGKGCYQAHQFVDSKLDAIGQSCTPRDFLFCVNPLREGQIILRSPHQTCAILGEVRDIPEISEREYDFCVRVSPMRKNKNNVRVAATDINAWQKQHFDEKSCGVVIKKVFMRHQMSFCNKGNGFWLPDTVMVGRLFVTNPTQTAETMMRGIGRHRAFGFGLLQLFPV